MRKYKLHVKLKEKKKHLKTSLFKPLYPWTIITGYLVLGLLVSFIFFGSTPTYLNELPDSYIERPYKSIQEKLVIYQGIIDGELYYFVEVLNGQDIEIYSFDYQLVVQDYSSVYNMVYFSVEDITHNQIMIQLTSNEGEENETHKIYILNLELDYDQFIEENEYKLVTN